MTRLDKGIDLSGGRSDLSAFLIVLGFLIAGFFIGQFVGGIASIIFAAINGADFAVLMNVPEALYDYLSLTEVLTTQMLYTLVFTFVTPWFYLTVLAKKRLSELSTEKGIQVNPAVLAVIGTFCFMVLNSYFIEWNEGIHFPEFMSGFEEWARNLEEQMAEATEKFTTFNNFGEFTIGFIAIAILPGIGEEIMFRGVLQNSLHRWTKNPHVAIWIAAFIFGAIHMQFFGLVPRMLLGAVFGYLYVWSGNIWYPIIAHATNNGLAVIFAYYSQVSENGLNIDEVETFPWYLQLAAGVLFIVLMVVFRNHYLRSKALE